MSKPKDVLRQEKAFELMIVHSFLVGKSFEQIAEFYNIPVKSVDDIIRKHSIQGPPPIVQPIVCPHCGITFYKRRTRKYCSLRCQNADNQIRFQARKKAYAEKS